MSVNRQIHAAGLTGARWEIIRRALRGLASRVAWRDRQRIQELLNDLERQGVIRIVDHNAKTGT